MHITRTINLTGRKKIPRKKIQFELVENADGELGFDGSIDFAELNVPSDGQVVVQPYYKSSAMWFDCGTVSSFELPDDTLLTDIDRGGSILFRVLVVDGKTNIGRILASAERVRLKDPNAEDERDALILIRERDIGHDVWKLEVGDDLDKPELVFNNKIPGAADLIGDHGVFLGLLLPSVMRLIMNTIFNRDLENIEDGTWQSNWVKFSEELVGYEIPKNRDADENANWIDELVTEFSKQHKLCDKLNKTLEVAIDD